jgi:DNA topoisomerase-3
MLDTSNRRVAVTVEEKPKKTAPKKSTTKPKAVKSAPIEPNPDAIIGQPCPLCGKGHIIKGRTAYGCSEWKNGCNWRKNF